MAANVNGEYPPYKPAISPPHTSTSEQGSHEYFRRGESTNGAIPPPYQIPAQGIHAGNGPWSSPYESPDNENLGVRLMKTLVQALTRTSHSVLRFELRGPIHLKGPIWGSSDREIERENQFVTNPRSHGNRRRTDMEEPQRDKSSTKWVQGIQGVGARVKFMQIWDFPNEETGKPSLPWGMNIGLGATMEIDRGGRFIPNARLQTKHAVLHILPSPCFELRGKFPIGGLSFVVDIRYRINLKDLENLYHLPVNVMVNSYSQLGTGFHIIPGALEFDEHLMKIGKYTTMRVAASVQFPSRIPLKDGEEIFSVNLRRLEFRTRPI